MVQLRDGTTQQQQPIQFQSGAAVARERRSRGAKRRSTDTTAGRQLSISSVQSSKVVSVISILSLIGPETKVGLAGGE